MKDLVKPENATEADVIRKILEENGIFAEIRSFHDTAYDGLFQSQYGWGVIRVPETDYPEAKRIVEEWKSATPVGVQWEDNE